MAHHEHKLSPPKNFEMTSKHKNTFGAMIGIGVLAFGAGLAMDQHAAWNGYLIGWWFTLSLALSGPFINSTQHLTIAGWSATIRRITMAYGAFIPVAAVLSIGGIVGGGHLFHWYDQDYVMADHILQKKAGFLSPTAFAITTIVALVVLSGVWFMMRKTELEQDEKPDYELTNKSKALSCLFLFTFVVGFSFLSWYWIMGLEPHWFSTMFNVYAFAGLFQSGLALTALIALSFRESGQTGDYIGERQIHDLGQLVFGFTVFYAYIAFCQFMLIWYANIPEEGLWYVVRGVAPDVSTGWEIPTLAIAFFKFILPFFVLLRQDHKKNKYNILRIIASLLIFMQLFEVWYWVAPTPHEAGQVASPVHFPLIELGIAIGFIGAFGFVAARSLASMSIVPKNDPFLHEAVEGHHHGIKPPKPAEIKIS